MRIRSVLSSMKNAELYRLSYTRESDFFDAEIMVVHEEDDAWLVASGFVNGKRTYCNTWVESKELVEQRLLALSGWEKTVLKA